MSRVPVVLHRGEFRDLGFSRLELGFRVFAIRVPGSGVFEIRIQGSTAKCFCASGVGGSGVSGCHSFCIVIMCCRTGHLQYGRLPASEACVAYSLQ